MSGGSIDLLYCPQHGRYKLSGRGKDAALVRESLLADFRHRASYLYVLRLDRVSLEAEFRRRRPKITSPDAPRCVDRSVIAAPRSPKCNVVSTFRLTHSEAARRARPFDLWAIHAARHLERHGHELRLRIDLPTDAVFVDLPADIRHGDRLAFSIPCGTRFARATREAAIANAALHGRSNKHGLTFRPTPHQLISMRALIALDAHLAGASYRQIAEAVFGARAVRERWSRDSSLKEQVRYLVRKALDLMSRPDTPV